MKKTAFSLGDTGAHALQAAPAPSEYRIPVSGLEVTLKKKAEVARGACLGVSATHGCVHAPVSGVVSDVQPGYVAITPQETEQPPVAPRDLAALSGDELFHAVQELGVSLHELAHAPGAADSGQRPTVLVINALDPEPGIQFCAALLGEHGQTLDAGLALLRRLDRFQHVHAVLPSGCEAAAKIFSGEVAVSFLKPQYPNSRPALAAFAATGKELPPDVAVLGLHTLWRVGRVAQSGLPLTEGLVSAAGKNWIIQAGTTVRALLEHAGASLGEGDRLVMGGVMRGTALAGPDAGIPLHAYAVSHIPAHSFAPVNEHPCINCGACVRNCPARLMPNLIGRNAEFLRYDAARELHVELCMDCGLCAYHCPARRPMLQYMRLSKAAIAAMNTNAADAGAAGE